MRTKKKLTTGSIRHHNRTGTLTTLDLKKLATEIEQAESKLIVAALRARTGLQASARPRTLLPCI